MTEPEKTCGTCRHWTDRGVDPGNIGGGRQGECRESVHVLGLPQVIAGRHQMSIVATYAATPASFPACSRHSQAISVVTA